VDGRVEPTAVLRELLSDRSGVRADQQKGPGAAQAVRRRIGELQNAERYGEKAAIAPTTVKLTLVQLGHNAQQAADGKITPVEANKKDIPLLMQYLNCETANCLSRCTIRTGPSPERGAFG
jgi:hypothetical protein